MKLLNKILSEATPSREHIVLMCYRGSIAHGTYIPNSNPDSIDDKDILGITLVPPEYKLGLRALDIKSAGYPKFEQNEIFEQYWDILIYEMQKFIGLLLKSNPNVLPMLWTPRKHYLIITDEGEALLENRKLFNSKLVYQSFIGYAKSQLHKMENMAFKGYMGEKRKSLVAKFGYDTKNAQHLIRLLRQGIEFLKTEELIVERPDAQELIDIKTGGWTLEQVKSYSDSLFVEIEDAFKNTKLPDGPDFDGVEKLLLDITYNKYGISR